MRETWVQQAGPMMRELAFTANEAADYLKRWKPAKVPAVTGEEITTAFREALASLVPEGL